MTRDGSDLTRLFEYFPLLNQNSQNQKEKNRKLKKSYSKLRLKPPCKFKSTYVYSKRHITQTKFLLWLIAQNNDHNQLYFLSVNIRSYCHTLVLKSFKHPLLLSKAKVHQDFAVSVTLHRRIKYDKIP